jgi:hypothetical protein
MEPLLYASTNHMKKRARQAQALPHSPSYSFSVLLGTE